MVAFPPCKINLGLNILARRSDGYHDIATCFYPLPWTDVLEILPAPELNFNRTGLDIPGNDDDNLCLKAYKLIDKDFKIEPVSIHLHKVIPTGGGLGGGSSDAAYTIRLLNDVFDLKISKEGMMKYASQLGSDCAFFIQDDPMMGYGRGEILRVTSVTLSGYFGVVCTPGIHVSTTEAYNGVVPGTPSIAIDEMMKLPASQWKDRLVNDFERTIFKTHPALLQVKESLYSAGALYASMSGSGSSVFGIFEKEINLPADLESLKGWSGYL